MLKLKETFSVLNNRRNSFVIALFAIAIAFSACGGDSGGGNGDDSPSDPVAPTITTSSLPDGALTVVYNQTLAATGTTPITWSIDSGVLPNGLSLNASTGAITGTPTVANTFNFTVKATNTANSATKALSITVAAAPVAPSIITTSLPNGTAGTAYSQTLTATGTAPITWTVHSGALPTGLTLSTGGVISGTPTAANTFNFTVRATNAGGNNDRALSIVINPSGGGHTHSFSGSGAFCSCGISKYDGIKVGNIIWATVNLDENQTFAERSDMLTTYWQWNQSRAWPATGSMSDLGETWPSINSDTTWDTNVLADILPVGWRLPTRVEMTALAKSGSTWRANNADGIGNQRPGRFYGPDHATATMSNMGNAIFIPANDRRRSTDGSFPGYIDGEYWSSVHSPADVSGNSGWMFSFGNSATGEALNFINKGSGLNIRLVRDAP